MKYKTDFRLRKLARKRNVEYPRYIGIVCIDRLIINRLKSTTTNYR